MLWSDIISKRIVKGPMLKCPSMLIKQETDGTLELGNLKRV